MIHLERKWQALDSSYTTQIAVTVGSFKILKVKERQNYKILEYKIDYVMIGNIYI